MQTANPTTLIEGDGETLHEDQTLLTFGCMSFFSG